MPREKSLKTMTDSGARAIFYIYSRVELENFPRDEDEIREIRRLSGERG